MSKDAIVRVLHWEQTAQARGQRPQVYELCAYDDFPDDQHCLLAQQPPPPGTRGRASWFLYVAPQAQNPNFEKFLEHLRILNFGSGA